MKNVLIIIVVNFCCFYAFADGSSRFVLTKKKSEDLKKACKSSVLGYYSSVQNLTGNNIDAEGKDKISEDIKTEYFFSDETRIEKDIDELAQPDYSVKDYLDNINLIYGKLDNVEINPNDSNMDISPLYLKDGNYVIVASVEREIIVNTTSNKKIIDVYYRITPGSKPKIFSIQHHDPHRFDGMVPLPFEPDENTPDQGNQSKPYFVFDVKPKRADIIIDGVNIYNSSEKIFTAPGTHIIEIVASNYYSEKFSVKVENNGAQPIELKLNKKQGYLAINANDPNDPDISGAEVYVDDDMVGNIPLSNYLVNVGSHAVYIQGNNGYHKKFRVTITDDNVTLLNINSKSEHPVSWWGGTTVVFAREYQPLYVEYPPRVVYSDYPAGYWHQSAEEHRDYERKQVAARMEYRETNFRNVRKEGYKPQPVGIGSSPRNPPVGGSGINPRIPPAGGSGINPRNPPAGGSGINPRNPPAGGSGINPRNPPAGGSSINPRNPPAGGVGINPSNQPVGGSGINPRNPQVGGAGNNTRNPMNGQTNQGQTQGIRNIPMNQPNNPMPQPVRNNPIIQQSNPIIQPIRNNPMPQPVRNNPMNQPNNPLSQPARNNPMPQPVRNNPMNQPNNPMPQPIRNTPMPQPVRNNPQPQPVRNNPLPPQNSQKQYH